VVSVPSAAIRYDKSIVVLCNPGRKAAWRRNAIDILGLRAIIEIGRRPGFTRRPAQRALTPIGSGKAYEGAWRPQTI